MSINKVIVSGNLTRDAELKSLPNGTDVLEFGIAVNERRKNQTGEWEDSPNYFDCSLYGKRAEGLSRYMVKGRKVAIEGKLQWRQWEKDGERRSKVSIVANEIDLMDNGKNVQNENVHSENVQNSYEPPADQYADSDIPF